MDQKIQRIIDKIAQKYDVTPESVYWEMQQAIDFSFDNPDPEVRKNWEAFPHKGERPTPEEFLLAVGGLIAASRQIS